MNASFKLFFTFALLFLMVGLTNAQAQRATVAVADIKVKVKDLDLNKNAKSQVLNWENATNFKLTKEGNFVPCFPKKEKTSAGSTRQNSRPYEGPIDLTIETVNCAKIPCPSSFDKNVVCWECH
ncbi:MAG: hypothetical protein AAFZ15_00850 [Bacteroidota bacterium]